MLAVLLFCVFALMFLFMLLKLIGLDEFMLKSDEIVVYAMFLSIIFTSFLYVLNYYQSRKIQKIIYKKNRKLKKQSFKISQKNAQQESLIQGICHEIKNPVAIIRLSAQSMQKNKFSDKIIYSCDKINKLLETLNATFIAGTPLKMQNVDIALLAGEVKDELLPSFKDRKISIFGEKILRCDRELFSLLLYNLCQNALKYSDDEVIIKLSKSGIFVRDFGVGFDKNEKNLLFKKFYKSSKFKHSGSLGFGLWACNQICKMHDFKLLANSTPKGTTFGVVC